MKFTGDVIITDPCYIIKKRVGKPTMSDYSILRGKGSKKFTDYTPAEKIAYERLLLDEEAWEKKNRDDWNYCEYGFSMDKLGITNYLSSSTECGDWACLVLEKESKETLGKFCADSGLVGVFLLEDVLKYNPEFDYHLIKPFTTALIRAFDGDIEILKIDTVFGEEIVVIGNGNVNFFTFSKSF